MYLAIGSELSPHTQSEQGSDEMDYQGGPLKHISFHLFNIDTGPAIEVQQTQTHSSVPSPITPFDGAIATVQQIFFAGMEHISRNSQTGRRDPVPVPDIPAVVISACNGTKAQNPSVASGSHSSV